MKKVDIISVVSFSVRRLSETINKKIEEGYSFHGTVIVHMLPPNHHVIGETDGHGCRYTQFMIKEIEE